MTELESADRDGDAPLRFAWTTRLDKDGERRWREFAERIPWAHYRQDPAWAQIESGDDLRRAVFFEAERAGELRLTALGLRRRLPIPGRAFWEFEKGPVFLDADDLDAWTIWLRRRLGREAARLRLGPPVPLDAGGDDVETALERLGFTRRRVLGGWATLIIDLIPEEDVVLNGFRSATRRSIRKSKRLSIEVGAEDDPAGWEVLAGLESELALTTQVTAVDPAHIARISRDWLRGGAGGTILVARHDGEPLAAALIVRHRDCASLPMIPSSRQRRDLPASHLLTWEAMRWARAQGCSTFDLAGYSLVARPGEALWGINQFKRGFATLDGLRRTVAVHERVGAPMVVASARALRETQQRLHRSSPAKGRKSGEASPDRDESGRP